MTDSLDIETKFFANRGVIGRRDYCINLVLLGIVVLILSLPANIYLSTHILNINDVLKINTVFFKAPLWIITLYMLSVAFQIVIGISNAKRRITDIYGKENNVFKYIFSFIIILKSIGVCFGLLECLFMELLHFSILIFLIFKKGKITSKLPYDATKIFNFGAFFGGWIWGLFNKVYYPLWQIILIFTPFSFSFSLYCGLKGNEWALNAKKYDDIEKFNSKQETQGIIFSVLSLIIVPMLIFVLYIAGIIFLIISIPNDELMSGLNKIQNYYIENSFEKCTFKKEENICFVYNDVWQNTNYKDKTNMMEIVAQVATEKKNSKLASNDYKNKTYKTNELEKTKLYSQDGKQLLAEFHLDKTALDSKNIKKIMKATANAYKFYPISK